MSSLGPTGYRFGASLVRLWPIDSAIVTVNYDVLGLPLSLNIGPAP
jgi:hypothetical protein